MTTYNSPTLIGIRQEELNPPPASTSCRTCPSSMWFTTSDQMQPTTESGKVLVKCFCKVMHCITWSEEEPAMPTACDGQAIGQAQLQLKREEADE